MIIRTGALRAGFVAMGLGASLNAGDALAGNVGDPFGVEFRVNASTEGAQTAPVVAMDAHGSYVITWTHTLADGTSDVYAQRYGADGTVLTPEFRVNTTTAGNQYGSAVAMDASGDYVITWTGPESSGYGVYAQRYASNDAPQGAEMLVPTTTVNDQSGAGIAMDADGDYVIVWSGNEPGGSAWRVWARLFSADGTPKAAAFRVDPANVTMHMHPRVAMDADGDFVVVWHGYDGGSYNGVWYRRYAADGTAVDAPLKVTSGNGPGWTWGAPSVAMDASGRFAVAWHDKSPASFGEAASLDVHLASYEANGQLKWSQRVNDVTAGDQGYPRVAMSALGNPVVAWQSAGQDGSGNGVYAQRFNATGADGAQVRANSYTTGNQGYPAVARDADGDAVVAWQSQGQDGSAEGIYAQRYTGGTVDLYLRLTSSTAVSYDVPYYRYVVRVAPIRSTAPAQTGVPEIDEAFFSGSSITLREELPPELAYVGFTGDNWWCTPEGNVVDCAYDRPLLQSDSATLFLDVRPTMTGTATTTRSIGLLQFDPSLADNAQTSTLRIYDKKPDPISFVDQVDVPRSTWITSNPVVITGITDPVRVTALSYSVNGGDFTSVEQYVNDGDSIRVRVQSSSQFGATVGTPLYIEGVWADMFDTTTIARDITPDPFAFAGVNNVQRGAIVTSETITPAGINDGAPISVAGGEYSLDNGAFTAVPGTLQPGQAVTVRHAAAAGFDSSVTTTLTVGGVAGTFTSTTWARDITPEPFDFPDVTGAPPLFKTRSVTLTIIGINVPAPVSIAGAGAEYRVADGAWTDAPGSIASGQTLQLRVTPAVLPGGTASVTIDVGGVTDRWTVRTLQ